MSSFTQQQQQQSQKHSWVSPARRNRGTASPVQDENLLLAQPQALGNQTMQRLLQTRAIQAKLTVSQPDDEYEKEADRVADRVMTMPAPSGEVGIQRQAIEGDELQPKPLASEITPLVQRQLSPEEEKKKKEEEEKLKVQTKPLNSLIQRETIPEDEKKKEEESLKVQRVANSGGSVVNCDLEENLNNKGSGQSLPEDVRAFMEPRFGIDFSGVRVHTDATAVKLNKDVSAQALTYGSDIYYGAGKLPGKDELTAHELTHVVQQTGTLQRLPTKLEQAAEEGGEEEGGANLSNPPLVLTVTNIGDIEGARAALRYVQWAQGTIEKALKQGEASTEDYNRNAELELLLDDYVGKATTQTTALSNFQIQYHQLCIDYGRINGMAKLWGVDDLDTRGDNKAAMADEQIQIAGGDPSKLKREVSDLTKSTPELETMPKRIEELQKELQLSANKVAIAQSNVTRKSGSITTANHQYKSACSAMASTAELKAASEAAKEKASGTDGLVGEIAAELVKASVIGAIEGPHAGVAHAAGGAAAIATEKLFHAIEPKLHKLLSEANELPTTTEDLGIGKQYEAQLRGLASAKGAEVQAVKDTLTANEYYKNAVSDFELTKEKHRTALKEFGIKLDQAAEKKTGRRGNGSDPRFQNLTNLLSESDTFIAQSDVVIQIGNRELSTSATNENEKGEPIKNASVEAQEARGKIMLGYGTKQAAYAAEWIETRDDGNKITHYRVFHQSIDITPPDKDKEGNPIPKSSAEDITYGPFNTTRKAGANTTIEAAIKDVEALKVQMISYRDRFQSIFMQDERNRG